REDEGPAAVRQLRPCVAQVAGEPPGRLLAEGHDPFLAALAANAHGLLLEVDVRDVEVDRLAAAQARRVDKLDKSAVAQGERPVALERGEHLLHLAGLRRDWQPAGPPRRQRRLGHALRAEREA